MDPERVEFTAGRLEAMADVLQAVSKVLEIQVVLLQTTAFVGFVGGTSVTSYLSMIKPKIDRLAMKYRELAQDIRYAVKVWTASTSV